MEIQKKRLFLGSCLGLIVTSVSFAVRAKLEGVFGAPAASGGFGLTSEAIGWAIAPAFWGFTAAMVMGGLVIDLVKTRTIVWAAFVFHLAGIVMMLLAGGKVSFYLANMLIGFGNGCVEAAFNPLVATLYPKDKTKMLNRFHVWFPGGIVIGSLLAVLLMDKLGLGWRVYVCSMFVPLAAYGWLFLGQTIPESERVTKGVSYKNMIKATGAPVVLLVAVVVMFVLGNNFYKFDVSWYYLATIGALFLAALGEASLVRKAKIIFPVMFFCMLLTAGTELVTTQFMNGLLDNVGINPMIVLVVITGLMAVGRFFAGGLVHRFNPTGVLLMSSVVSAAGLYLMSVASGPLSAILAAVVFAVGVCYYWPTMIGFIAEYVPESGALGMSIMGGAGMVAVSMFLPLLGKILDSYQVVETMTAAQAAAVNAERNTAALRSLGVLPLILTAVFFLVFLVYRNKKAVELGAVSH